MAVLVEVAGRYQPIVNLPARIKRGTRCHEVTATSARIEPERAVWLAGDQVREAIGIEVSGRNDNVKNIPAVTDLHACRIERAVPVPPEHPQAPRRVPSEQVGLAIAAKITGRDDPV